jgi:hypothetical protein
MASHHPCGVPSLPPPTAPRKARFSDGSGVTETRNGLRRTSSASTQMARLISFSR